MKRKGKGGGVKIRGAESINNNEAIERRKRHYGIWKEFGKS
jgi:hypothetical protein